MRILLTLALVALCSTAMGSRGFNPGSNSGPDDPNRVSYHTIAHVDHIVTDATGDSGTIQADADPGVTSGTLTIASGDQPNWPRELFIVQDDDDDGDDLSVKYVVTYEDWTGTNQVVTVTLTGSSSKALPIAVADLTSIVVTTNASESSDTYDIGYRGWYLPGSYINEASDIVFERIGTTGSSGDIAKPSTAGTAPGNGFYLPDPAAVAADDVIIVGVRTTSTSILRVDALGATRSVTLPN